MKFKILWIDDRPSSIKSSKNQIEEFLKEKGFEPDIEMIQDVENIKKILDEKINGEVDLIVTDNDLDEEFNGLDVIKKIGEKKALIDVLFYSTPSFDEGELMNYHHFIEIVRDKTKILEPLKKLIKKNIKRCEDPVFLRGYVLSRVVDLEIELNELFEIYFEIKSNSKEHFHGFLMENRNFSLSGKSIAFSKLLDKNKEILKDITLSRNKLEDIASKRNILAHCKIDSEKPNCFISMGDSEEFGREKLKELLKKINEALLEIGKMKEKLKKSLPGKD
ncbi:hypothetical protein HYS72_02425 [Candidatus Pacearchaeota archaeon]|nr:hypothetical protein [Candidatus Pacearchaeota archaeon]MBI2056714.1 hypothetical protein [Candidatus Pacearchaeota archaeon]